MKRLLAILLAVPAFAQQQPVPPHAGFVYPAGARQGTTVEVTVGGQSLTDASEAYVSGTGIKAQVVNYVRPLTPMQAQSLREQAQMLVEKRTAGKEKFTADDERTLADIRKKLNEFTRRPASPALAEIVTLKVTVEPNAEPGERELRIGAAAGITNPISFCIDSLPEISRPPAKVPPAFNVVNGATPPNRAINRESAPTVEITLPVIVNGQMMPGTVDRYRFHASQGQKIVVAARARELIPYISDAVPGWFQATLTLRDSGGKELTYAGNYRFHPDPVLYYEIPRDGEYTLDIHDSIFRGREDFVYRIMVGEVPFVTGIFPLGGKAGTKTAVQMQGWNLPVRTAPQQFAVKGVHSISAGSNRVPFAVDSLPESILKEANTRREKAMRVKLPVIVNGRIAHPGDSEFLRFDGRAGQEIVAEVFARRLDSPLDSVLRLMDSAGRELMVNDDCDDKGAGLLTHQADSKILFRLPKKGTYYLQLADAERQGGPEFAYRLRISEPQPDFELRVAPSSINLRAGSTVPFTVYALRRDGFAGEVALKLQNAPSGFVLSGAAIPAGAEKVRLTLTVPRDAMSAPLSLQMEGKATLDGREIRRTAIPAEDMMQAFAYRHLVAAHDWMVRVIGAGQNMPWRPAGDKAVRIPAGGAASVEVFIPPRLQDQVRLALDEAPEGIAIQDITPAKNGMNVVLRADPAKAKPGLKGNLIVDAFVERPAANGQPRRRQPMGTLPAIPFEIVPSSDERH